MCIGGYKKFIYSRTRAASNLGSALNAVLSIGIIVALDSYQMHHRTLTLPLALGLDLYRALCP